MNKENETTNNSKPMAYDTLLAPVFYDVHYYDSNGQNEQHLKLRADNIEHATERFNKLKPTKYLWKLTAL